MKAADLDSVIAALAAPPARPRRSLPCRTLGALDGGEVSSAGLASALGSLAFPPRTVALLTGDPDGMGAVDGAVVRWAHARTTSLVGRLCAGESSAVSYRDDVVGLTGLGPGLTPTGDDLLVGLAAMAQRFADAGLVQPAASRAYRAALGMLAPETTTPVALELLRNASQGLYPSVLAAVVDSLGRLEAEPTAFAENVRLLVATGAHSGADLLAGALALALAFLPPPEDA